MVNPLVWGAFLASEAYASKKRDEFAKDEALRNQPKNIYYDKQTNTRINQDDFNVLKRGVYATYGVLVPPEDTTSKEFKNYSKKLAEVNAALNTRYPRIGSLSKDGKETYPPNPILENLMYGTQKPTVTQIISDSGESYVDMATFAAREPDNFRNKRYVTQEISFTRSGQRQEKGITDVRPDPKEKTETKLGVVPLILENGSFKQATNNKNYTHRGLQVKLPNGSFVYRDVKDREKSDKKTSFVTEPVFRVKGTKLFGENRTGTLEDLTKALNITSDEDIEALENNLVQIGSRDVKYDAEGNVLDIKNRVTFNIKDEPEPKVKVDYYVVGTDKDKNKYNVKVPANKNYAQYISENNLNTYPAEIIQVLKHNPETNEFTEVMKGSKGESNKTALGVANGGYIVTLNSTDKSVPPIKLPLNDPNKKSETKYEQLERINLFYDQHEDLFTIESRNKLASALVSIASEAYTVRVKSDRTQAETMPGKLPVGMTYSKDIKQFLNLFPALSRMNVQLTTPAIDGQRGSTTSIPFGSYILRMFNKINVDMLNKQVQNAKDGDPDKYVVGVGNVEITANKNIADKLTNVQEGEKLNTNMVLKFDDKYKEVVDYLINTAQTKEEKTDITNFIIGQSTLKSTSADGVLDYTGENKGLDGLVNIFKIKYPISVDGKVKQENGLDLLLAFMHPNWTQSARFKAAGSKFQQVALAVSGQSDGDFTKAYNFLLKIAPNYVDGNLALRSRYSGSKKSIQDIKEASRGIVTTGRNAKTEQQALRGTYFGPDGQLYPFGAAAGQFILTLRGGLYVGTQLFERAKETVRTMFGVDRADKEFGVGVALDETDPDLFTKVKNAAYTRVGSFRSVMDSNDPDIIAKNYNAEKEAEARQANKNMLDTILQNMNRTQAYMVDGVDRLEEYKAYARRSFHKFMLAYQLAAAIQGGTGGRTISDQDVQNILSAFNFNFLSDPKLELEAIDRAGIMLDRLITYNQAIADGGPKEMFVAIATDRLMNEASGANITKLTGLQVASFIKESGSPMSQGNVAGGGMPVPENQMTIGGVNIPKIVDKKAITLDKAYQFFRQYELYSEQKPSNEIMSKEKFQEQFNIKMGI